MPASNTSPASNHPASRNRRILALWFPTLSTDRLMRLEKGPTWLKQETTSPPHLIIASIKNVQRIVALNDAVSRLGLSVGTSLADARARYPHIKISQHDEKADTTLLETIADWADRYTPLVALDPIANMFKANDLILNIFRHGLILDITGCAHLFQHHTTTGQSAEEALVRDIRTRLLRHGFQIKTGLASSVGAAWALSRFQPDTIIPKGEEKGALTSLPLSGLRLPPDQTASLEQVGLKQIGQLYTMPRAPLAARFGLNLIKRLDQALGDDDESISPRLSPPDLITERRFPESIARHDDIETVITSLAEALSLTLDIRAEGARLLEATLFHSDGEVTRATIVTSRPVHNPHQISRLFKDRLQEPLERFERRMGDAATGFDIIRLSVLEKENTEAQQIDFNENRQDSLSSDLAHLIDKLSVRFGKENIYHLKAADDHLPEKAQHAVSSSDPKTSSASSWSSPDVDHPITRPIRLFDDPEHVEAIASVPEGPPLKFRWRRVLHTVKKVEGPERISAHWWEEPDKPSLTRDYYRVEDDEGRRFWLYRDGLYHQETSHPSWYMHGLFA